MLENKDELKQMIKEETLKVVREYMKTSAFTDRKLTDLPTDGNQVMPRKFATANGTFAMRPSNPVTGQRYFPTDLGYPAFFDGTNWVGGVGSVLGA